MLSCHRYPRTNVLEFTLDNGMTRADFDRVASQIEEILRDHGKIRLVEVIRAVGQIDLEAIWADLTFSPRHLRDFSHVAVVTDYSWMGWISRLSKPLTGAEIETFPLNQLGKAREWIMNVDGTRRPH